MSVLRDLGTALRLLTIVPVRGAEGDSPIAFFTWVGWLYAGLGGGIATLAWAAGRSSGLDALLAAAVIMVAWGGLSGFLHWDGLADAADGLGVRGDAAQRLSVMRDSTIGAFGVVAVVLVALVQVASLAVIVESGAVWGLGAPVFGRLGAALALWLRAPASTSGLAARYARKADAVGSLVLILPVLPLLVLPFPPGPGKVLAAVAGITCAVLVPLPFAKRLGGINGDVAGATIVLTETFVLLIAAAAGGLV